MKCAGCDMELTGKQRKWHSNACKNRANLEAMHKWQEVCSMLDLLQGQLKCLSAIAIEINDKLAVLGKKWKDE